MLIVLLFKLKNINIIKGGAGKKISLQGRNPCQPSCLRPCLEVYTRYKKISKKYIIHIDLYNILTNDVGFLWSEPRPCKEKIGRVRAEKYLKRKTLQQNLRFGKTVLYRNVTIPYALTINTSIMNRMNKLLY